ncbi:carbohydrate sulfotransferase 15-like [Mercenaria mercenaria]|uniref:carbohydrate sulfotransferase 15-like n=1 Tax=Mercenaria mercenaria TaxID=6596 RepID=UPI00234EBBD4|nr:carbohydrate sulfotransferase 15-like [Mercenaria mercenaria]
MAPKVLMVRRIVFILVLCTLFSVPLRMLLSENSAQTELDGLNYQQKNIKRGVSTDSKGQLLHKQSNSMKQRTKCSAHLLYNKIFQQENLVHKDLKLEQNIEKYCGARENVYRILDMDPIRFDPAFKNPCWIGTNDNGPVADDQIHCLPYFYILGVKKCGTTDIFSRLNLHPLFKKAGVKEHQWFPRLRFGRAVGNPVSNEYIKGLIRDGPDVQSVNFYIAMFDPVSRYIQSNPGRVKTGNGKKVKEWSGQKYHIITGDATTNTMFENPRWRSWPGNEGLSEPHYTNLHYIKHLTPAAKIIIFFRDPVKRLYSDFLYTMRYKFEKLISPQLFHKQVLHTIAAYKDCFKDHSLRHCFYNETIKENMKQEGIQFGEAFHGGFYAFLMREIYSVFDKQNVLPLVMFDKEYSTAKTMKRVFLFLEIGIPDKEVMTMMLRNHSYNNTTKKKRKYGSMLNETKRVLQEFYRPYNQEMAEAMKDDRYLFDY